MGVNYGLDKVRFMNATPVGSLVRARVSLISTEDIAGGLRYKMKLVFELKGRKTSLCCRVHCASICRCLKEK